jgi:hypothetical protein
MDPFLCYVYQLPTILTPHFGKNLQIQENPEYTSTIARAVSLKIWTVFLWVLNIFLYFNAPGIGTSTKQRNSALYLSNTSHHSSVKCSHKGEGYTNDRSKTVII